MMNSIAKIHLLKQILFLFFIGIALGIIKVEFFISFVKEDLISRTRIISYMTLFISSIFFYIIIILAITSSYYSLEFLKLGSNFNARIFFTSIKYFIWSLILNEISKFIITIFTFKSNSIISNDIELNSIMLSNHLWLKLINYSDLFFIVGGCFAFSITLKEKEAELSYFQVLFPSVPLFLSFLVFRSF